MICMRSRDWSHNSLLIAAGCSGAGDDVRDHAGCSIQMSNAGDRNPVTSRPGINDVNVTGLIPGGWEWAR